MSKKILDGIKYWSQALLIPIYWLSFLTPRDKKIWIFGSTFGNRFADNPKYLYLYTNQYRKKDIRAIWISRNKQVVHFLNENQYEAYYYHSLKGIYYCLRGSVYIFDNYSKDISFWQSGGAVKVNLWHGVGNKKINYDNKFDKVRHPKNNWDKFRTYLRRMSDEKPSHYILATSERMSEIFAGAFQVDKSHLITEGYPRNDVLLNSNISNIYTRLEEDNLKRIFELKKSGKIIDFYMPTFRDSEIEFLKIMNLNEFNRFLVENHIVFVTKLHPKSKLKQAFKELDYSNIINLEAEIDPYVFLKYADILTTDYSSIYSDYMLLNRPVVAFQYDYDVYSINTREGYFDFDEYMPEVKAKNMHELMQTTKQVLQEDMCREKREKSREMMFSSCDGNACENIINRIMKLLKR
jgi:CDP-glycerol glycerophosphotransferase (TagB/SpsB family)